jgi:hypothetical protein
MHANDSLRQTVSTDFNDNKVAPSATVPRWTRRLSCWSRGSPTEEVLLLWGSSAGFEEEMGLPDLLSDSAHGPSLDSPVMEVMQPESPAHLVQTAAASGISRGSSSEGMLDGVILSKAKAALTSKPRKRHTKTPPPPVPRRSSHLARKACGCTPAVPVAQNILMKKLNIPVAQQLEAVDFEQYLRTFKDGLSVEQVKMIQYLFGEQEPLAGSVE